MHEGRPNIVDAIKNGGIQLVINTPAGRLSKYDDSYIRKAAIKYKDTLYHNNCGGSCSGKRYCSISAGTRPCQISAKLSRRDKIKQILCHFPTLCRTDAGGPWNSLNNLNLSYSGN